jgi:hypothetical protein
LLGERVIDARRNPPYAATDEPRVVTTWIGRAAVGAYRGQLRAGRVVVAETAGRNQDQLRA